jgi:hypothetical protein
VVMAHLEGLARQISRLKQDLAQSNGPGDAGQTNPLPASP